MSPVHKLGSMTDPPPGRTWTCQRVTNGQKCGTKNPARLRKCVVCGKPRPKKKRPDHMRALDLPYEVFLAANGGREVCGICGKPPKPGKRLHRDHDHATGEPRGLLDLQCNRMLGNKRARWLRLAAFYLERHEDRIAAERGAVKDAA